MKTTTTTTGHTAIIHPSPEGGYWAEAPALPGCVTQAETREELEERLREAVEGWLAVKREREEQ